VDFESKPLYFDAEFNPTQHQAQLKSCATGIVSAMSRLCPTLLLGCLCIGCSGQDVVGRWKGPWPMAGAEDCRTQLKSGSNFELVCAGDSWVGVGRYSKEGDSLKFAFQALASRGEVIKEPQPVEFVFEGRGNEMSMRLPEATTDWTWRRILPSDDAK
jgi:hypothetical protein